MIDNTGAAIAERENKSNKRIVEQFSKTDAYKELTTEELKDFNEQYGMREVPRVVLGSSITSLESLINFQVRDQQGDVVDLNIRPLAANESKAGSIELNAHDSHYYRFVVASEDLRRVPAGIYYIAAGIDTRNEQGMWQGWTFSKTLTVKLVKQAGSPDWAVSEARAQLLSTYLIEDRQFPEAEVHARAWLERHPDSVDAWAQLGESLYGQRKHQAALDAFIMAINSFRKKYGESPAELPIELIDRINQIEKETGIRPPLNPNDPVPDENTPRPANLEDDA